MRGHVLARAALTQPWPPVSPPIGVL